MGRGVHGPSIGRDSWCRPAPLDRPARRGAGQPAHRADVGRRARRGRPRRRRPRALLLVLPVQLSPRICACALGRDGAGDGRGGDIAVVRRTARPARPRPRPPRPIAGCDRRCGSSGRRDGCRIRVLGVAVGGAAHEPCHRRLVPERRRPLRRVPARGTRIGQRLRARGCTHPRHRDAPRHATGSSKRVQLPRKASSWRGARNARR